MIYCLARDRLKMGREKMVVLSLCLWVVVSVSACALRSGWHWEKAGADAEALSWDQNQCKAKVYAGSSGAVTNETVRRMFACMEGKGWSKVGD